MPTLRELGLETYEIVQIARSQLVDAPYNPRLIGEAEKRKLKAGLKKHGLVAPITWNARTGHIVSGHQRIKLLDALAGSPDYELTVARIDVDEAREKELNILLNNPNAQGDWDMERLNELLRLPDLDLQGAGFDHADVYRLFGESSLADRGDALDELAEKVREFRDRYQELFKRSAQRQSTDFYMVVVFRDAEQLSTFLQEHGLPDNRYQSGEEIMRLLAGCRADELPPTHRADERIGR